MYIPSPKTDEATAIVGPTTMHAIMMHASIISRGRGTVVRVAMSVGRVAQRPPPAYPGLRSCVHTARTLPGPVSPQ